MFFIAKGDCTVLIQDRMGLESGNKRIRTLYSGDHFGVNLSFFTINIGNCFIVQL